MHRVLTRSPDGEWKQEYEGTQRACLLFISQIKAARRRQCSPIVTRRTLEQWQKQAG